MVWVKVAVIVVFFGAVFALSGLKVRRIKRSRSVRTAGEMYRAYYAAPYGVRPPPTPGAARTVETVLAGQPAMVSLFPPARARYGPVPVPLPGTIRVETPLGPAWPALSVMLRKHPLVPVGLAIAKHRGTRAPRYRTGNRHFDRRYLVFRNRCTGDDAARVLSPQVQAALCARRVRLFHIGGTLAITVVWRLTESESEVVRWATRLSETVAGTAGFPLGIGT